MNKPSRDNIHFYLRILISFYLLSCMISIGMIVIIETINHAILLTTILTPVFACMWLWMIAVLCKFMEFEDEVKS